jgi:hypothetical protein
MSGKLMSGLFELRLTDPQLLIALALADHGKDDGSDIFPSIATVAWKVGKSDRQARRIMRQLEQIGLLIKVADAHRYKATRYRIDLASAPSKPPPEGGHNGVRPAEHRADIVLTGREDTAMANQGGHGHGRLTVREPSFEPSSGNAAASPLPPEARPEVAHGEIDRVVSDLFILWRWLCRSDSSRVQLTAQRAKAIRGRLLRDRFTVDELRTAIYGAAAALDADALDHDHHDTDLFRVMVDAEHVRAWIEYEQTGDPAVLSEMLLSEEPRQAT